MSLRHDDRKLNAQADFSQGYTENVFCFWNCVIYSLSSQAELYKSLEFMLRVIFLGH